MIIDHSRKYTAIRNMKYSTGKRNLNSRNEEVENERNIIYIEMK